MTTKNETRLATIAAAGERRQIRNERQREARRTDPAAALGAGPDESEPDPARRHPSRRLGRDSRGSLWRRSEALRVRQGPGSMRSDARGLPPGYATGPTWIRAAESSSYAPDKPARSIHSANPWHVVPTACENERRAAAESAELCGMPEVPGPTVNAAKTRRIREIQS